MVVEDICPREKDFGNLVEGIRKDLVRIVHGDEICEAVLFACSGTGAVEACLTSVVEDDKSVLVLNNGAYGKRMQQICDGFGIPHIDYVTDWGMPIDYSAVEKLLTNNKDTISHIAVVHHETTVGILNDLDMVAKVAAKYDTEVIVDAMSSFAGIPIDLRNTAIHYLVSSSNKCIQGMAGLSFVLCNRDSLLRTKDIKPRNFYFNLYQNYSYFSEHHQMQFTPPVQVLYALRQAINEYFLETEHGRAERYAEMYDVLTEGLEKLGFQFLVEKQYHAKILTAVVEPVDSNYSFSEMHHFLFEQGFTIYPGKSTTENTFRLANMGAITTGDMKRFLACLEEYLTMKNLRI